MLISRSESFTAAYCGLLSRASHSSTLKCGASTVPISTVSYPRPWCVLPQMTPFGNTSKNVPISLLTASGVLSYSCTNSVTVPPGLSFDFASSKNSFVYSVAAPFTHGSSGSDVIASNRLVGRQQKMPRIVDDDVGLRVSDDVEIVLAEMLGDDARHERLDFGDRQRLPRSDRC